MRLFSWLSRFIPGEATPKPRPVFRRVRLNVETLEERTVPSTVSLSAGVLTVNGTPQDDRIAISLDASLTHVVVQDSGRVIGRFPSSSVNSIQVFSGNGNDRVEITSVVKQPALIEGGNGKDILIGGGGPTTIEGGGSGSTLAGGTGPTTFAGGSGNQLLVGGTSTNTGSTGSGATHVQNVTAANTIATKPTDTVLVNNPHPSPPVAPELTTSDVQQLLLRATAADPSGGAIIAVVDRNGRILGVRVDNGVSPLITGNTANLVFAIDGAVSLARSGALFSSNAAPLTSRTVSVLSQSTITQREVESNPSITNLNSTLAGPGFVAPVRTGAHFPPGVPNTPEVDLFDIEGTNRDTLVQDGVTLPARFNINTNYVPSGQTIYAPVSYGYASGLMLDAQPRGIATLPGGDPIYELNAAGTPILVGGIGVFFPGTTGYADAENSSLSETYNPSKPDLSFEAEYIAFAAAGGVRFPATPGESAIPIGTLGGIPPVPNVGLEGGRIDLVGIQLDEYGPGGLIEGPARLLALGQSLGTGNANAGVFEPVAPGNVKFLNGLAVPDGWLVVPHNGVGITAAEVDQIILNGITQAQQTRSALRLPLSSSTRMVLAVTDLDGNVVGLYRMSDAPVFSIGVAVAKARNVAYYDNPSELQSIDELPGIAPGVALTNRTFRFLALPRYPSGDQSGPPGYFSLLNDGGSDLTTALNVGPPLPASAFQSVLGYDSFHPNTNFHDPFNPLNQNGVVFFPGSAPLYQTAGSTTTLIGGFGVSGDGVDQDDVVTTFGQVGYVPQNGVLRADQVVFRGVSLPYQKYDRNPEGGVTG